MMNAHVHPLFRDILNDFAAPLNGASGTPRVVHTFRSGQVVKQRMEDYAEARQELAAIVRNFRNWGFYVVRDGGWHRFYISAIDGSMSKTVELSL